MVLTVQKMECSLLCKKKGMNWPPIHFRNPLPSTIRPASTRQEKAFPGTMRGTTPQSNGSTNSMSSGSKNGAKQKRQASRMQKHIFSPLFQLSPAVRLRRAGPMYSLMSNRYAGRLCVLHAADARKERKQKNYLAQRFNWASCSSSSVIIGELSSHVLRFSTISTSPSSSII